jgi:uncharacterized membrane protein (TIGR02234 family)
VRREAGTGVKRLSPRRLRTVVISGIVATSALGLLCWSQRWFVVKLVVGGTVEASGSDAAAALAALSFASLALAGTLIISGFVFRLILGVLQCLVGVSMTYSAWTAILDPGSAVSSAVTAATGIAGRSVRGTIAGVEATPWPALALAVGILALALGIVVLISSPRWPVVSSRFDRLRTREPREGTPIDEDNSDEWQRLSRGEDPTTK